MEEQIEPVQGTHQAAFEEHRKLLHNMRRSEGREPERQAEDNEKASGEPRKELFHRGIISHAPAPFPSAL